MGCLHLHKLNDYNWHTGAIKQSRLVLTNKFELIIAHLSAFFHRVKCHFTAEQTR